MTLDGAPYAPSSEGNRVFAFATQNPDHQWCGATLAEDLARRRAALARHAITLPPDNALAALAAFQAPDVGELIRSRVYRPVYPE